MLTLEYALKVIVLQQVRRNPRTGQELCTEKQPHQACNAHKCAYLKYLYFCRAAISFGRLLLDSTALGMGAFESILSSRRRKLVWRSAVP